MARGRMISRSLGTSSKKFAALHKQAGRLGDFAQALFPLLVVNSDDFGIQPGDAFTIKHSVFSISPHSELDFETVLFAMQEVDLIRLYESEGATYLQILNFEREQPGLRFDKRTKPRFPLPPEIRENSNEIKNDGKLPEIPASSGQFLSEEKVTRREDLNTETSRASAREPTLRQANATQDLDLYSEITGKVPSIVNQERIEAALQGKTKDQAIAFFRAWDECGYNPRGLGWLTWLENGEIPERVKSNGKRDGPRRAQNTDWKSRRILEQLERRDQEKAHGDAARSPQNDADVIDAIPVLGKRAR